MDKSKRNSKKIEGKIMKTLVIILNKDNGDKLKDCLNSLVRQNARICEDFDVLILDGNSKDNSKDVAGEFEKKYPCIRFKVQNKLGGTGFARREGCNYALTHNYDLVIWGDSENFYDKDYIKNMVKKLRDCDAVGGIPKVKGGFYAHAFAWYHAVHIVFHLYRYHIPGNNKGEKTEIYKKFKYPASKRAEDYGFSMLLLKNNVKLKQCLSDSIVYVSLPDNFKEVLNWQRARAKGTAGALKEIGVKPWDNLAWAFGIIFLLVFSLLIPLSYIPLLIYLILLIAGSIALFFLSKKFIAKPKLRYFLSTLFGLLIYSIYSFITVIYYLKK